MIDFGKLNGFNQLLEAIEEQQHVRSIGLMRSAHLQLLISIYRKFRKPILYIVNHSNEARSNLDNVAFWDSSLPKKFFAEPAPLFYERSGWDDSTRIARLKTLISLALHFTPDQKRAAVNPVIFSSVKALMTKTIPRRDFLMACHQIKVEEKWSINTLQHKWLDIGYEYAEIVVKAGQFSHRGGILDIWPIQEEFPVRIDFLGDKVDTIRIFNPATQRSIEQCKSIFISPAREYLPGKSQKAGAEKFNESDISVIHRGQANLADYLPRDAIIFFSNAETLKNIADELEKSALEVREENIAAAIIPRDFPQPYLSWSELLDTIQSKATIDFGFGVQDSAFDFSRAISPSPRFGGKVDGFTTFIMQECRTAKKVEVVSRQVKRIKELWDNLQVGDSCRSKPVFLEGSLDAGWKVQYPDGSIEYLFTDNEIFGWQHPKPRHRQYLTAITPETQYADLQIDDWVVHFDYGIGRFKGLVRRPLDGVEREYLCVEYRDEDQLFVPIHQADRLGLYISPDGRPPKISRLGTQEWKNTKFRVRGAVRVVAGELLELYAKRRLVEGFAFSTDTDWQGELEISFPYEETVDQARAIEDVKHDMEVPRPMDRLLCGDVGYGKTEVALRAAFKAVMDGKQVAMLVPTTILAQQHFDTFLQRLVPFPVKVEMLSRFRSHPEQMGIILGLKTGDIDIVIGTHRLLQADVQFKDLGLLIVDEEQRFGVMHKEYFKKMRTEIDVLTLTATPIPRTLYMALSGVRDISAINTPPSDRLSINTYVSGYDSQIVRKAIMREVDRSGQVFFVHNRVRTIYAIADHLRRLVPEARLAIAHGQMREKELAVNMRKFTRGEIDVLLATSIIESGLDIPNANTLIVDRSDALGLSQLYQLRGRVGRGGQRAYAYFFYSTQKKLTPEGRQRLEVIAENTQLGAGYSIAMRDMEMRGAGDLLGTQQHGFVAAVGFHLYTRLLAQAIKEFRFKNEGFESFGKGLPFDEIRPLVSVDLPIAVGIPLDYVKDHRLRLKLYRRLANIHKEVGLETMCEEFKDRFGDIPEELGNLFWQLRIKLLAKEAGISSINSERDKLVLRFPPLPENVNRRKLPDIGDNNRIGKNGYWLSFGPKNDQWKKDLESSLVLLIERLRKHKE
ncbi:MAG TPA: transcription-repair coupling factor [Anaerolineae bacterium]|nr:transcription-repair coupling factor [Anaerolineae bacterium]